MENFVVFLFGEKLEKLKIAAPIIGPVKLYNSGRFFRNLINEKFPVNCVSFVP